MKDNPILEKSAAFALRIVNLYKYIKGSKNENVLSKQLVRCGTSVGANVAEAQRAQTRADFHAKMCIAQKEANETAYWLELLHSAEYLSEVEYNSIRKDIDEVLRLLGAICKTTAN